MNFLILGCTGYLGQKVVRELILNNHSVVGTVRETSDKQKIVGIDKRIKLISASPSSVETAMLYDKFDWVINLSGNYGRSTHLYQGVLQSNIEFPLYILDLAANNSVKNYMTIGTGLPKYLNMYSFSKDIFSEFGKFYAEKHKINFYNMRLQMLYGADEPKDRFIVNCVYKMLNNIDVEITEGVQHRDIIHVDDVIKAILCVVQSGEEGYYDIDVGTGEAPTIREIVEYIHEQTDSKSQIKYGAIRIRDGEPDCIANIEQLLKMGFNLSYDWKTGINNIIEIIKKERTI